MCIIPFPFISPAIFHAIGARAALVLTLHNYRLFCPAAIPIRAGRVCTECLDTRSVWPALRYGCYRNSRLSTLPLAFSVALHRNLGTWTRHVDAFIALTKFQRETMVAAGLPEGLVHVKPNFITGNLKPGSMEGSGQLCSIRGALECGKRGKDAAFGLAIRQRTPVENIGRRTSSRRIGVASIVRKGSMPSFSEGCIETRFSQ